VCGGESASDALIELAAVVARERIGGDVLSRYLERRMSVDLVEMHAACRCEAARIAADAPFSSPDEVADALCQAAADARSEHMRRALPVRFGRVRCESRAPAPVSKLLRARAVVTTFIAKRLRRWWFG